MFIKKVESIPLKEFIPKTVTLVVETEQEMRLLTGFIYLDVFNEPRANHDEAGILSERINVIDAIHELDLAVKMDGAMNLPEDD